MRAPRRRHLGTAVVVGVAALVAATLVGAPASAQAAKKFYTASISPTNVPAGAQTTVQVTLSNITANQYFASANITFALPYSGTPNVGALICPSVPACADFSATVTSSASQFVVQLRSSSSSSGVPDSGSVVIPVSFTPTTDGTYTIGSAVKQSNDFSGSGNDFLLSGSAPQLTVAGIVCTASPCTDSGVHTSGTVAFDTRVGSLFMNVAPNSEACVSETRPEYVVVDQMLSSDSTTGSKSVELAWDKQTTNAYTDNGTPHWEVCMSAPYGFYTEGSDGTLLPPQSETSPTQGPLPLCSALAAAGVSDQPCISDLFKVKAAQHAIVQVPGNPQDPKFF